MTTMKMITPTTGTAGMVVAPMRLQPAAPARPVVTLRGSQPKGLSAEREPVCGALGDDEEAPREQS
jgi:hypothetical protein